MPGTRPSTAPTGPAAWAARGPGLALALALAAAAALTARLPGLALVGPVVLALLAGVALGATPTLRRGRARLAPGLAWATRVLLRVGIVLLGVRLDARQLLALGPWVLLGGVLGACVAFATVEVAGRAARVPADLRRSVAIGTAICGASAIAAALPVLRARPVHASLAIASISLLGTGAALAFAGVGVAGAVAPDLLGAVAGGSLQEVGHVVAAATVLGADGGDLALLVKLTRVVLLAPALIALAAWERAAARDEATDDATGDGAAPRRRPPLVPLFVLGFLAVGAATSAGLVPAPTAAALAQWGTWLTAAAMAAIGLSVDVRGTGPAGRAALRLAVVGFVALLATMSGYYLWVLG